MVRKTKEEAQETRNAILDAAEVVFQERGVSHTSLAEVAKAAGVTRGAIYWHFANKAALYDAMIQRVFAPLDAKFDELRTATQGNPVDLLRSMVLYFIARVVDDAHYFRLVEISWHKCEYVGEMATIRDTHLECGHRYLALSEDVFRLAQERGQLPASVDPRCAAVGLMAVTDGLVVNWTLDKTLFPLADYGPTIIDAYLAGLCAATRPAGA
jgi:TetR/AcrR family acrAB operon transcriptional repressor